MIKTKDVDSSKLCPGCQVRHHEIMEDETSSKTIRDIESFLCPGCIATQKLDKGK